MREIKIPNLQALIKNLVSYNFYSYYSFAKVRNIIRNLSCRTVEYESLWVARKVS